jgi:hypothetical protein
VDKKMKRKAEVIGSTVGGTGGTLMGLVKGSTIGIAVGGTAFAGTIPCAIVGALIVGLAGNKIGTEIDRHYH